jgi:hypothetical protein
MTHLPRAVAVIVALVVTVTAAGLTAHDARAAGDATAVVVIDTGTSVRAAVIHFDTAVTGIEALQLAGANPVTQIFSGQGGAVCKLDGVGNEPQSCLVGPDSQYWAYWLAHGGATSWSYSRGCACTVTVHDGDVEGWRYGLGDAPRAAASFCSYVACGPPPTAAPPAGGDGGAAVPGGDSTGAAAGANGAAGGGGAGAAAAGGGTAPSAGTPDGSATGAAPTAAAAGTTTAPPSSTTSPRRGGRGDVQVEGLSANPHASGGGDSGSPIGVAIAVLALAATGVGAVLLRRRRMRASSG